MLFEVASQPRTTASPLRSRTIIHMIGGIPNALLEARRGARRWEGPPEIAGVPSISVAICAYNEEQNIGALLSALVQERIQQIILVASGCTDRTVEIARQFQRIDGRIRIIVEEYRQGKTSAVNLAMKCATSEFIVFLPADVRPSPGSILKLVRGFKPEVGIRVGRPLPLDGGYNVMGRLSQLIWTLHNRTLDELSAQGNLEHASGEFFALRNGLIKELPRDVVNDDAYIAVAVRNAGFTIDYEDDAIAFMRGPGTVSDYVSQRRRVHFGHMQVMKSTGRYPTVFEFEALVRPAVALRILREELRGIKGAFRTLLFGATLEVIALMLSGVDRMMRRSHIVWRMVESTKTLSGALPVPFQVVRGTEAGSFSRLDAFPGQSLDRSHRSGLALGRLSPRLEVLALRAYMCC